MITASVRNLLAKNCVVAAAVVIAALMTVALVAPALAAAPLVNAELQPAQITLGESAELTITTSGNGMDSVSLPQVDGLEFRVVGQSRRLEIINGATLATASVLVRVTPTAAGIFTIPGITPKSQPLVLRVSPDNGEPSAGTARRFGNPAPGAGTSGLHMSADGSAFVRLVLPKRDIYVGESIPVDIEVGMRSGFVTSLNGLPTLTGGDFTLNNLSHQPERVEKLIDGKPFVLLTWHSIIAAVKPGSFSLAAETPLTVRIRTRPQRDSMIDDMLGDPFMQNFFGATVPKDITVTSPAADLTVLALPTDGRPANFSGAVGSFKMTSEISAASAAAGDPLTLRMHVSGAGNFDRVDSAMLDHVDGWKTYPPKSTFKAADGVGYKGEKTFEQPIIAAQPGAQTLPGLTFSYFDPTTKHYEITRSPPLDVSIAPALADGALHAPPPGGAATPGEHAANDAVQSAANRGLRPDHAVGATSGSLVPLDLQPRFVALPPLLALAMAGVWLGLRRRASPGRTADLAPSKAAQRVVHDLEAAARARDAALFFNTARAALRLAPAEDAGAVDSDRDSIRQILALADEANYAGLELSDAEYQHWTRIVSRLITEGQPA